MRKIGFGVLVAILLLIIGVGVYYKFAPKNNVSLEKASSKSSRNVISSIQDALSKSISLECHFTDDQRQVVSYIKNGAIRADITSPDPQQTGSVIVKDKMVYFWNSTMGMKMTLPELSPTEAKQEGTPTNDPNANVIAMLEKYKDSCKPAVVADTLFTVPTTVKFQDMSAMAHPTGMTQEQMQQMMQQYQNK